MGYICRKCDIMARHNLLGNKGEMLAARYLAGEGLAVLEYNWRSGHKEIDIIAKERDVLVFVESLDRKYRNAARLSFSTKITDYLKSGKCVLAIGGEDIAPIDYFKRYDSAITATSYKEIKERLIEMSADTEIISRYAKKAYDCGRAHHDKKRVDETLRSTIVIASKKGL